MDKKRKIIIIAIVAIVIIIIIIILMWLFIRARQMPGIDIFDQPVTEPKKLPVITPAGDDDSISIKEPELEANLKTVAIIFAERFGSYSNEGNFQNLNDLRDLMTIKMSSWTDNFIIQQKDNFSQDQTYYGITTQALSTKIIDFDESLGRAEVRINTQRQEVKSNTNNPRVFYQEIILKLVKTGAGWKVDEVNWQ